MTALLIMLGVVGVVIAILLGFATGTVEKALNDPELKDAIEREKRERERQKAWRDKVDS